MYNNNIFDLIFTSKFLLSLYYLLKIKKKLLTALDLQINSQIIKQKRTTNVYLCVFVNYKQNNLATLLPMSELIYNNMKNSSISFLFFELNCGFQSIFFAKKILIFDLNQKPQKN